MASRYPCDAPDKSLVTQGSPRIPIQLQPSAVTEVRCGVKVGAAFQKFLAFSGGRAGPVVQALAGSVG